MKQADKEAFLAFWTGDAAPVEEPVCDPADDAGESPQQPFAMSSFTLRFAGPYSADHLANSLRRMIPEGAMVSIVVECRLGENNGREEAR